MGWSDPVSNAQVPLSSGWNAVGFQSQQLTTLSAPQVAGLAEYTNGAYVTKPATVENVNGRRGYWVYATAPTSLTYSGVDDGQGKFVELTSSGYQLVSFATSVDLPLTSLSATQNGATVPFSSVVLAIFEAGPNTTATVIKPGKAYWVFADTSKGTVRVNVTPPVTATSLALTPQNPTVTLSNSQTFTLLANGSQDVTQTATFESSQPSVASPVAPGVFKALNAGTTQVTARYGGLTAVTNLTVTDFGQPGPAPSPAQVPVFWTLDASNNLAELNPATGTVRSTGTVTGVAGGFTLQGLGVRPTTNQLYALGFNFASVGTEGRLYLINPDTRAATQVGAAFPMPNAIGSTLNAATQFGFAFNPVVDRIRIMSSGRDNFRLNPDSAAVLADTIISPAGRVLEAAAYTNQVAGATSTTLYAIDPVTDALYIVGGNPVPPGASPNGGVATLVGPLGVSAAATDVGLTIARDGVASATLTVGGVPGLYTIDLATGAATLRYALPPGVTGRSLEAGLH